MNWFFSLRWIARLLIGWAVCAVMALCLMFVAHGDPKKAEGKCVRTSSPQS